MEVPYGEGVATQSLHVIDVVQERGDPVQRAVVEVLSAIYEQDFPEFSHGFRPRRVRSEMGTVQGGSISPLLANVYLHYVRIVPAPAPTRFLAVLFKRGVRSAVR